MTKVKKPTLWRIYAFSTIVSVFLLIFAGIDSGIKGLLLVLTLAALEVSLSFDNAVVNARILKRMSAGWQKVFLTVGIFIAVFGVRVLLPIGLVAIAIGHSFGSVVDLALNHPAEYGHKLHDAHPMIAAFGGIFLLLIFLEFFFETRHVTWLNAIEGPLHRIGSLKNASSIIAVVILLIASRLVHHNDQETVIMAGLAGLLIFMIIHSLDDLLQRSGIEKSLQSGVNATFKAGLLGFIYLEIIDASFSLDGVIGAFAITDDIVLIAIGLGIGALYVRTITLHMLQRGTLEDYRYIEHGAHYAIGILAFLMILSLKIDIPEIVTGLTGLVVIVISIVHSHFENKRDAVTA